MSREGQNRRTTTGPPIERNSSAPTAPRLKPGSEATAAFLLSLFPPAGLLAGAFVRLLRRAWRFTPSWTGLWLGFGAPLALCQLLFGRGSSALHIALLGTMGLVTSAFLLGNRRTVVPGLLSGLAVLALLSTANVALETLTWSSARIGKGGLNAFGVFEGEKTRRWYVPGGASEVEFGFGVRWLSGPQGWFWHRSHPAIALAYDPVEDATHISFPNHLDPYVMRWLDTGEALGGRTFQASVDLRSERPIEAQGQRGLWLQVWEGRSAQGASVATEVGRSWRTFSLEWTVPPEVADSVLRLILNDFNGLSLEVRDVTLRENRGGRWIVLSPLAPAGLTATLATESGASQLSLTPTEATQRYTLSRDDGVSRWVSVTFGLEHGVRAKLTDVRLSVSPGSAWPRPTAVREQLWFTHPNLMGHAVTALGLVSLALAGSLAQTFAGASLMLVVVSLTGSRSAWLAAIIGLLWSLALLHRRRLARVFFISSFTGVIVLLLLSPASLGRLSSLDQDVTTPRWLIWQTAWQALLTHPWQGLGDNRFEPYFSQAQSAVSNESIPHAHNLWLQFAASYGLPGLLAILWLTGGLVWLAWRWGRWRGLALIVPILLMNIFDYTLFYSGVLFPLILGMNALHQGTAEKKTAASAGLDAPPATGDNEERDEETLTPSTP